jgi:hypothetical protein
MHGNHIQLRLSISFMVVTFILHNSQRVPISDMVVVADSLEVHKYWFRSLQGMLLPLFKVRLRVGLRSVHQFLYHKMSQNCIALPR